MEFYKSKPLIVSALAGRDLRQKLISSNIANIDTPYYKARDIDFETMLEQKANLLYKKQEAPMIAATNEKHFGIGMNNQLALTNKAHQLPFDSDLSKTGTIFARDGHLQRNDANTVDLDVETSELSKNAIMVSALDSVLKKQGELVRSIIENSSKLN